MNKWLGMRELTWNEVMELHEQHKLPGYYLVYPFSKKGITEKMIPVGYDITDIKKHYDEGFAVGELLPTVHLSLGDGKEIEAPEVVDISELTALDELEYSLWETIEEYMAYFGIRTTDDEPDYATVKAVQDTILSELEKAGVKFEYGPEQ